MDLSAIKQKCLVVAVWDKDNKSHDDFMAGVSQHVMSSQNPLSFPLQISIGLQQVQSFDDKEVQVNLHHQDVTGHVSNTERPTQHDWTFAARSPGRQRGGEV